MRVFDHFHQVFLTKKLMIVEKYQEEFVDSQQLMGHFVEKVLKTDAHVNVIYGITVLGGYLVGLLLVRTLSLVSFFPKFCAREIR
jgi:hypothetical protein